MILNPTGSVESANNKFNRWLHERYEETQKKLLSLLNHEGETAHLRYHTSSELPISFLLFICFHLSSYYIREF